MGRRPARRHRQLPLRHPAVGRLDRLPQDATEHARRRRPRPAPRRDVQRGARRRGCTLNGRPLRIGAPPPLARALVGTGFSYVAAERAAADGARSRACCRGRATCAAPARPRSTWPGSRRGASTPSTSTGWPSGTTRRAICSCARRAESSCRCRPPAACAPASWRARAALTDALAPAAAGIGWQRVSTAPPTVAVLGARARPRAGPPRRRHGTVGDPLRRPRRRASRELGTRRARPRHRRRATASRRSTPGDDARQVPRRRSSSSAARSPTHVERASRAGELPLVLGGDHSLALGVLRRARARARARSARSGSTRTPTATRPRRRPSGNVHGMGLSGALGWGGERFAGGRWPSPSVDEDAHRR